MSGLLLKVGPAETARRLLSKTYDLQHDRTLSIAPYDRRINFYLLAPNFEGKVYMTLGGEQLQPIRGMCYPNTDSTPFCWSKPTGLVGRAGHYEDLIIIFEHSGERMTHSLQVQIAPGHLDDDDFEIILADLVYLIWVDWHSRVTLNIHHRSGRSIEQLPLIQWNFLQTRVHEMVTAARTITQNPHYLLNRTYQRQSLKIGDRLDRKGLVWLTQRGLSPDWDLPLNVAPPLVISQPSTNTPENRFVAFVLQQTNSLLQTLESAIARQLADEKLQQVALFAGRNRQQANDEITARIAKLESYQVERQKLKKVIQQTQQMPLYQQVTADASRMPLHSLVLRQEPHYRRIFDFYTSLEASMKADWLGTANGLTSGITKVGNDRTSYVYEIWAFVRVFQELSRMQFVPMPSHGLETMIRNTGLTERLYSGSDRYIELSRTIYQNQICLRLFHERTFDNQWTSPLDKKYAWRPDITVEITYHGKSHLLFLDAKYKAFDKNESGFQGLVQLRQELFEKHTILNQNPGIEKYLAIPNAIASFILHPTYDPRFENYGAKLPKNKAPFTLDDTGPGGHKLGYIPFLPQNPSAFRKLLGMIFVVILGIDYYCWNCHSTVVEKLEGKGEGRKCLTCNTVWYRNKCHCGGPLVLIKSDEVPFQAKHSKGNYICPSCGQEARAKLSAAA